MKVAAELIRREEKGESQRPPRSGNLRRGQPARMSPERWTALVDAPGVVADPEPIRSVQCNTLAIDLGPSPDAPHLVVAALVGGPPAAVGREVMGRQVCRRLG